MAKLEKFSQTKKTLENSIHSLKNELKVSAAKLEDQKKKFNKSISDLSKEKAIFDNKEKQFLADIRKKEGAIKNLQDRIQENQFKAQKKASPQTVLNSMEVTGEILKNGPNIYTNATGDFLKMINDSESGSFKKLKEDNEGMRLALFELQSMMSEIVKIRKAAIERTLGGINFDDSHFLTELK